MRPARASVHARSALHCLTDLPKRYGIPAKANIHPFDTQRLREYRETFGGKPTDKFEEAVAAARLFESGSSTRRASVDQSSRQTSAARPSRADSRTSTSSVDAAAVVGVSRRELEPSSNHGVKRAECDDGRPSKEKVQTAPFSRAPTMLFVRAFASVIPSLRPHDAMHAAISSQRR